jgi:Rho GDP-dissociation inhibitor
MAPHDEELLPEDTAGYKLSQPKQTLEQYQKMGKFWTERQACLV